MELKEYILKKVNTSSILKNKLFNFINYFPLLALITYTTY